MIRVGDVVSGYVNEDGVYANEIASVGQDIVAVNIVLYAPNHDSYEAKKSLVEALNDG